MDNRRATRALSLLCSLVIIAAGAWGHDPSRSRPARQTPPQEQARKLTARGLKYVWQKDYHQAIKTFEVAARLDPEYPDIYLNWGVALGALGQHHEEIEKYQQAVRYHPSFGEAYAAWAVALHQLGRQEEAKAKVREALAVSRGILGPIELLTLKMLGLLD